jgi:hypothetical protein
LLFLHFQLISQWNLNFHVLIIGPVLNFFVPVSLLIPRDVTAGPACDRLIKRNMAAFNPSPAVAEPFFKELSVKD